MAPKPFRTILKIASGGRIVIPLEVRQQLDMNVGQEVVLTVENDRLTLMNARAARRHAQDIVANFLTSKKSMSRELLAERKAEARRE